MQSGSEFDGGSGEGASVAAVWLHLPRVVKEIASQSSEVEGDRGRERKDVAKRFTRTVWFQLLV